MIGALGHALTCTGGLTSVVRSHDHQLGLLAVDFYADFLYPRHNPDKEPLHLASSLL